MEVVFDAALVEPGPQQRGHHGAVRPLAGNQIGDGGSSRRPPHVGEERLADVLEARSRDGEKVSTSLSPKLSLDPRPMDWWRCEPLGTS